MNNIYIYIHIHTHTHTHKHNISKQQICTTLQKWNLTDSVQLITLTYHTTKEATEYFAPC
jgi:hypothetical protein